MHLLGIDIGGTKVSLSIGTAEGKILHSERIRTQSDDVHDLMLNAAQKLAQEYPVKSVGIAAPGPVDVHHGCFLTPPNLPEWHNLPIRKMVKERLNLPTFMNNDANACALAEYHFGHRKKTQSLVYLTMSTGMGGGIIENGHLIQGPHDTAGEVGHIVLDIDGPRCPCGQRGCFEVFCGGGPLAHRIQEELKHTAVKTSLRDTKRITMQALIKAVRDGDHYAHQTFDTFITRLAQGIGSILMICNPRAVILGTIAMHAGDLIIPKLQERLHLYCWKRPRSIPIEASILTNIGDLSAIAVALQERGSFPE